MGTGMLAKAYTLVPQRSLITLEKTRKANGANAESQLHTRALRSMGQMILRPNNEDSET